MKGFHQPVLLDEVVRLLNVQVGGLYIDSTIGGGGHAQAILEKGGRVLGLDVDESALAYCAQRFNCQPTKDNRSRVYAQSDRVILVRTNFRNLTSVAASTGFKNAVGILMDLGVSSYQLETGDYGLSFQIEAPLDMRMDKTLAITAADLVNALSEAQLKQMFLEYGEEKGAAAVARAIVDARKKSLIKTTTDLKNIVGQVLTRKGKIHPATRVFQALRIVVNSELQSLTEGLHEAHETLKIGGRLVVISFHSLEDHLVKKAFKEPIWQVLTAALVTPSQAEVTANPRSRSAKLRAAVKIS